MYCMVIELVTRFCISHIAVLKNTIFALWDRDNKYSLAPINIHANVQLTASGPLGCCRAVKTCLT